MTRRRESGRWIRVVFELDLLLDATVLDGEVGR